MGWLCALLAFPVYVIVIATVRWFRCAGRARRTRRLRRES